MKKIIFLIFITATTFMPIASMVTKNSKKFMRMVRTKNSNSGITKNKLKKLLIKNRPSQEYFETSEEFEDNYDKFKDKVKRRVRKLEEDPELTDEQLSSKKRSLKNKKMKKRASIPLGDIFKESINWEDEENGEDVIDEDLELPNNLAPGDELTEKIIASQARKKWTKKLINKIKGKKSPVTPEVQKINLIHIMYFERVKEDKQDYSNIYDQNILADINNKLSGIENLLKENPLLLNATILSEQNIILNDIDNLQPEQKEVLKDLDSEGKKAIEDSVKEISDSIANLQRDLTDLPIHLKEMLIEIARSNIYEQNRQEITEEETKKRMKEFNDEYKKKIKEHEKRNKKRRKKARIKKKKAKKNRSSSRTRGAKGRHKKNNDSNNNDNEESISSYLSTALKLMTPVIFGAITLYTFKRIRIKKRKSNNGGNSYK